MSSSYRDVYDRRQADPIGFWKEAAADIDWFSPPTEIYRKDIRSNCRSRLSASTEILPRRSPWPAGSADP
jgi:Acetyl-coenzyme A synthetase N-terminus